MTISEIKTSHFTTYSFTASNDIGISTEMIILEEDKSVADEVKETYPETEEVVVKKQVETELSAPVAEDDELENGSRQEETDTPELVLG